MKRFIPIFEVLPVFDHGNKRSHDLEYMQSLKAPALL